MAHFAIAIGSICMVASIVALFFVRGKDGLILAVALLAATLFQLGMFTRFVASGSIYVTLETSQLESLENLNSSIRRSADAVQKLAELVGGLTKADQNSSTGLATSATADTANLLIQIEADLKASKTSLERARDGNGRVKRILNPSGSL
jgi:hypothetical protein